MNVQSNALAQKVMSMPCWLPSLRGIKIFRSWLILALGLMFAPLTSIAASITYSTSHVSGNKWTYGYMVSASPSDSSIEEVTIFFDESLYANLTVDVGPSGWSLLAVQPDLAIPARGFFDALARNMGIGPGSVVDGFTVSFDFLGAGAPGTQQFDIVDPITFETVSSGMTSKLASPPTGVPEVNTLAIASLSLVLLMAFRRKYD